MFGCNPHDYDLKVELAKCFNNISTVFLARHIPTGEHVAVKKFRMDKAKEEAILIRDEILTMRQFNHPNILSYHTAFVSDLEIFVVSPLMCFGSCKDTLTNCFHTGFPEIVVALILRDVLSALEYLHRKGFIHRSIRASHILLNQTKAVLTGFRECTTVLLHGERIKTLHELAPCSGKSLNWLAPEVLEQNLHGYTEKSDIFSIGITACELANGIEPFADMQSTLMLTEKIRGNQPTLLDDSTCPTEEMIAKAKEQGTTDGNDTFASQTRLVYSKRKFSDAFHKFAEVCLERHPTDRPTAVQLLNHPFCKQCKHTSLFDQLLTLGVKTNDYSGLRDDSLSISNDLGDMTIGDSFEWDF